MLGMTKRFTFEKNTGLKNDEVFVVIDNNTDEVFSLENERESNSLVIRMNELADENEQLKSELKRCKEWLNSDKYDYQTTLAFIKSKGYSLQDVLEYGKR